MIQWIIQSQFYIRLNKNLGLKLILKYPEVARVRLAVLCVVYRREIAPLFLQGADADNCLK